MYAAALTDPHPDATAIAKAKHRYTRIAEGKTDGGGFQVIT